MGSHFPRRRRGRPDEEPATDPVEPDDEPVRLDDADHAWWAQRDIDAAWTPRGDPPAPDEPKRDILAEHFGEDWRTSFGLTATAAEPAAPPSPPGPTPSTPLTPSSPLTPSTTDPYEVLEVDATASWDDIVAAHRTMARRHHPDLMGGRSDDEVAASEDRIRVINMAYQELRIRRGR